MESENNKIIRNFISTEESLKIKDWVESILFVDKDSHKQISELSKSLNGTSQFFDISKSDITKYVTDFQSSTSVVDDTVPEFIMDIINRISISINIPKSNMFLQVVNMSKGGVIDPHYDTSMLGYINYKCNISILSEDYTIFIGDKSLEVKELDLYCFEASLYKHWTEPFSSKRILLSFGFMLPYSILGRSENDPRIRLSNRIEKIFQK